MGAKFLALGPLSIESIRKGGEMKIRNGWDMVKPTLSFLFSFKMDFFDSSSNNSEILIDYIKLK